MEPWIRIYLVVVAASATKEDLVLNDDEGTRPSPPPPPLLFYVLNLIAHIIMMLLHGHPQDKWCLHRPWAGRPWPSGQGQPARGRRKTLYPSADRAVMSQYVE